MNKLKYHFLGGLVFLGTIVFGYIGYTTYTNLATQADGATITQTIWNDVITTINSIGTKTDGIYNNGGNVGIGTNISNINKFKIKQSSAGSTYGIGIFPSDDDVNAACIGREDGANGSLILRNQGSDTMYIKGGNVGIGTYPIGNSKLTIKSISGNQLEPILYLNSSLNTNARLGTYINLAAGQINPSVLNGDQAIIFSDDGSPTTYTNGLVIGAWSDKGGLKIMENGNVGIGLSLTNPSYTLQVNGTVAGTSWTATSDSRYKKDVETLTGSLDKIDKLRGVEFKRKSDEYKNKGFDDKTHLGFIAQEVEKVYPEIVNTDKEGYKSVEYANITSILVEAVKELKKENEELKTRLDKLEK